MLYVIAKMMFIDYNVAKAQMICANIPIGAGKMANNNSQILYKTDYLEEILEHFQDGIYITDNEANTVYLNHSYERISGLTVSDMLGKNMKDLVEQGVVSMSGTLTVLETGREVTMEQSFRTGRRAIITSTPIFKDWNSLNAEQYAAHKADGVSGGDVQNRGVQNGSVMEGSSVASNIVMVVTIVRETTEIHSARKELRIQEQLRLRYQAELEKLKKEYQGEPDIVAEDGSTRKLMRMVDHVRLVDAPILLTGERGSGKRRIAAYVHEYSGRSEGTFLRINFAAMPKDDPAGYLFGRKDADGRYQIGMLESADGGTVYFEDLSEMPGIIQDRILSLLRDGQCVLGDGIMHRLDIRMIAGSIYTIEEMRRMKKVSPDILYAFSMFALNVPPLRQRRDDIVPLAEFFLERSNKERGAHVRISKAGFERMLSYKWPENVLELENMVSRAAIICQDDLIDVEDLFIQENTEAARTAMGGKGVPEELPPQMDLREEVAAFEAAYMKKAFEKYGNIRDASEYLGMDASTFTRKRQKYVQMGLMDR